MRRTYIGIDNGVTGAVGIVQACGTALWFQMPVRKELSYTKAKKYISRIDVSKLRKLVAGLGGNAVALIERPMVNPGRFAATLSAMRALEATLIALEQEGIPFLYLDSKEWQKTQLPSGLEGPELKKASLDIGRRLWPHLTFPKGSDADALHIARHGQQKNL